jgi:MFS family permease
VAKKKFTYSPNVKKLAAVSFFTDFASEMLYPIMPLLWSSFGFSAQMIGIIEGVAEAVAGLSKLLWGYIADRFNNYKTLVVLGYGLSAVSKPLLGVTSSFIVPLAARNVERLGKAIRTAPRDAILAAESSPEDRARVIGFHRAMDTLGAVVGPAVCLLLLLVLNGNLQAIFLVAAIPGILAVAAAYAVDDRRVKQANVQSATKKSARPPLRELLRLPDFKKLVIGLGLFALINSSDAFLILRLSDLGLSPVYIVVAYMLYNTVYAVAAKTTHRLVTRIGMRGSILLALVIFTVSYALLSLPLSLAGIIPTLMLYGFFAGLFEVVSKTWLVNVLPAHAKATGVGLAGSATSLGFLVACLVTGALWSWLGSADTLAVLAIASVVPLIYFGFITIKEVSDEQGLTAKKIG